jgi:hypothetical protein
MLRGLLLMRSIIKGYRTGFILFWRYSYIYFFEGYIIVKGFLIVFSIPDSIFIDNSMFSILNRIVNLLYLKFE